jgi:PadR family transcriptional regulator, regulatory protein PadR
MTTKRLRIVKDSRGLKAPRGTDTYRTAITQSDTTREAKTLADSALYGGLIRLHLLHHAAEEPIFGLGMIVELRRHGYRLSAGTLYPILHSLERRGYLRSTVRATNAGRFRRFYRITARGRRALAEAKVKVRELVGELFEST